MIEPNEIEPHYLKTKEILSALEKINCVAQKQMELEDKMNALEMKVDSFLEERKNQRKRILEDLKSEIKV